MKPVPYSALNVGDVFTVRETIDRSIHEAFAELSGDRSLIHSSDEHARQYGFTGRLGYGFLLTTFISRLVGTYFESAICVSVTVDFVAPVFIGDALELRAVITVLLAPARSASIRLEFSGNGNIVATGKLLIKFLVE